MINISLKIIKGYALVTKLNLMMDKYVSHVFSIAKLALMKIIVRNAINHFKILIKIRKLVNAMKEHMIMEKLVLLVMITVKIVRLDKNVKFVILFST